MRDYCYRNSNDTVRVKVFYRSESRMWDYDVFHRGGGSECFSTEAGDAFLTKRAALQWATQRYGNLRSFNPGNSVVNGF